MAAKARHIRCWVLVMGCVMGSGAWGLEWSSNEIQFLGSARYAEPANPDPVGKRIVTLQHASGYALGRNFAFVDFLHSGNQERDLSGRPEAPTEIYGEAYTTLSLSRLSGHPVGMGVIKDVGLTAGVNLGEKGSQLHSRPRVLLAGVTVDIDMPRGFFNIDVLAYRDRSCYDGIGSCPDYRTTHQITPSWAWPFSIGAWDWEFTGFADFIGSRGAGTRAQILSQPQLRVDIGKPFGTPGVVYAGFEYQYWRNKFGIEGVHEHHPQWLLAVKF